MSSESSSESKTVQSAVDQADVKKAVIDVYVIQLDDFKTKTLQDVLNEQQKRDQKEATGKNSTDRVRVKVGDTLLPIRPQFDEDWIEFRFAGGWKAKDISWERVLTLCETAMGEDRDDAFILEPIERGFRIAYGSHNSSF
jgi:hypothetical protein